MRNSLKKHALDYLKTRWPEAVEGGVMEDLGKGYGYSASNTLRRCRELARAGIITAEYYRGNRGEKLVKYRFNMPTQDYKKREVLKEVGRIKVEIVEVNGERIAKEVII